MLVEARNIMDQKFSPRKNSTKASSNLERGISSFSFKLKQQDMVGGMLHRSRKRNQSHMQTEIETPPSRSRRIFTQVTPSSKQKAKGLSLRISLLDQSLRNLMPSESQLLSTKIYGFQKQSCKTIESQILPKLQLKSKIKLKIDSSKPKKHKRVTSKEEEPSIMIKTIGTWEHSYLQLNKNKKKRIRVRDITIPSQSPDHQKRAGQFNEDTVQPWQFCNLEHEQFFEGS